MATAEFSKFAGILSAALSQHHLSGFGHMVQYFGYRTFDDVTLATHMYRFSPEGSSKLTLISFDANPDISDSVFRKPGKLSEAKGD